MNHCLRYFSLLLTLVLAGGGFLSCSDDPKDTTSVPSFEVAVGTVDSASAELLLKTNEITEYAWLCVPAAEAQDLTPAAIFATGTAVECTNGNSTLTISNLTAMSDYIVYLAAKTADDFYNGVITPVSFKTTDYADEITIVKRTPDGFVARIRLPEEVVKRDNVVKWNIGNLLVTNMNKMQGMCDADMLVSSDEYYGKYFKESTTLIIDEAHAYKLDENGEMVLDENGDPIEYWNFIAPGEPLVLLLGEHEYGESMYGWGEGWYKAMFDYDAYFEAMGGGGGGPLMSRADQVSEADYWTGYYKHIDVRAAEPEVLNAKVKFEATDLRPNGGILQFTPEEGVLQYCIGIFDNATYEGQVLPMLDNKEEYLQWFTTSYAAAFLFGTTTLSGPAQLMVENIVYPSPGVPYHILITAMGDEKGLTQSFTHEVFELPEATLPAPNIVAKPIKNPNGEESPYEVWFNVKSPDGSATKVGYACNYARDFNIALGQGSTYASLISQSRALLSSDEVAKVNSSEGYNMMFNSREDAATRLAVMAWNIEGTASNPDAENSPAIADNRTIALPDAERVESSLFQDLLGDWTATATVKVYQYNDKTFQYEWVDVAKPMSTKVTIAAGVTYPATLPSNVYALYPNMTKDEVDALYAEFKNIATTFNSKVRGQNRLLCLGYNFNINSNLPVLSLQTPYDLFVHEKYSAPQTEDLFYEFGPKWYMQITKDNTVFVPVNINRLAPMSVWADGKDYSLAASGTKGGLYAPAQDDMNNVEKWPNIPVEVSADKQTITLKKLVREGEDLYPSVIYPYYSQMALFTTKVWSEVVLKKGWSGQTTAAAKVDTRRLRNSAAPTSSLLGTPIKSLNNGVLKLQERPKSRTVISTKAPAKYKQVKDFHIVTPEEVKANMVKFNELQKAKRVRK